MSESGYRAEFERRIKAVLLPEHVGHDTSGFTIEYSGTEGDTCPTCGYDSRAEIIVRGTCGCDARVYAIQNLAADDFGTFMARVTDDGPEVQR